MFPTSGTFDDYVDYWAAVWQRAAAEGPEAGAAASFRASSVETKCWPPMEAPPSKAGESLGETSETRGFK